VEHCTRCNGTGQDPVLKGDLCLECGGRRSRIEQERKLWRAQRYSELLNQVYLQLDAEEAIKFKG